MLMQTGNLQILNNLLYEFKVVVVFLFVNCFHIFSIPWPCQESTKSRKHDIVICASDYAKIMFIVLEEPRMMFLHISEMTSKFSQLLFLFFWKKFIIANPWKLKVQYEYTIISIFVTILSQHQLIPDHCLLNQS